MKRGIKKYKNITKKEFKKKKKLIKRYGKWGNADGDYKNGEPYVTKRKM